MLQTSRLGVMQLVQLDVAEVYLGVGCKGLQPGPGERREQIHMVAQGSPQAHGPCIVCN